MFRISNENRSVVKIETQPKEANSLMKRHRKLLFSVRLEKLHIFLPSLSYSAAALWRTNTMSRLLLFSQKEFTTAAHSEASEPPHSFSLHSACFHEPESEKGGRTGRWHLNMYFCDHQSQSHHEDRAFNHFNECLCFIFYCFVMKD